MKIVILGASGKTGKEIVKQALEQSYEVTAFVRDPRKLRISHPNLSIIKGDVHNLENVEKAVANQNLVISALGTKPWRTPVCAVGVKNIISAMKKHRVNRIIAISAYGTGQTKKKIHGRMIWLIIPSLMEDKEEMESLLQKSNLDWTILKPVALTNSKKHTKYRHSTNLKIGKVYPTISRIDVASFILRILDENLYTKQSSIISY